MDTITTVASNVWSFSLLSFSLMGRHYSGRFLPAFLRRPHCSCLRSANNRSSCSAFPAIASAKGMFVFCIGSNFDARSASSEPFFLIILFSDAVEDRVFVIFLEAAQRRGVAENTTSGASSWSRLAAWSPTVQGCAT